MNGIRKFLHQQRLLERSLGKFLNACSIYFVGSRGCHGELSLIKVIGYIITERDVKLRNKDSHSRLVRLLCV